MRMPQFEFVNVGRPGEEKKQSSKIRRHVMKDIVVAPGLGSGSQAQHEHDPVPSPLGECKLSEIVFPIEMNEERRDLARYLFAEARSSYMPFRFPWLSIGLSDAAAWYITLANAVLLRNMKPNDAKPEFNTDNEAMKWYTLSLQSVSKRLADPEERKEGLIGAITGFICHDTTTGNFTRQEIHLQGLKRLVDDIGGIDEIINPALRFMISWHDLTGASFRNSHPYFGVPKDSWNKSCPYLGDIHSALKGTAAVASYVNQHCQSFKFWTDDMTAARLLAPALHEVLSLEGRALPSSPSDPSYSGTAAREAFRRSSLIFLASLKAKFGATNVELKRHLNDFRQISQIPHVDWALVPELNLWAHTIAALEEESYQRSWHISAIVSLMKSVDLTSSQQALDVVRGIIWVEALFVDKVETLCREIDSLVSSKTINGASETFINP
ncbi:hypothetical protein EKO27_g5405 [Xylaria grammica]|uniref:Uncharacterized protein n=1 Tax=Xylaria grammica TaxID=363999 RepID=A0A439D5M2_9PEZI|nr:hypothetical protein EKO27_g5405 [Xylaria grammica]